MGRVLGVDLGSVRVGLARSDETGTVAEPLATLPAEPAATLPDRLADAAREAGAGEIVVGLPKRLDGGEGPEAKAARRLAAELRGRSGLPVALIDERLSTAAAERALIAQGARRSRRRAVVDQVAATLILQSYLAGRDARR